MIKRTVTQEEYRQKYIQTLSSSTPQQLVQKNWEPWKSYFAVLSKYRDPDKSTVTDRPSPPGYRKEDGERTPRTVIRNEQYTVELGERSRLEIPVGKELKEKYGLGYHDRLRLEVAGELRWTGKQGRLEIVYDRDTETVTADRTVGDKDNPPRRRDSLQPTTLATTGSGEEVVAAVDIGANNLAAVTTTQGDHCLSHGRPAFHTFHAHTERIAERQSILGDDEWSSKQIRRAYHKRGEQRNHAMDALIRDLGEWLFERGVSELIVGALGDVRRKHWSATVTEKTDLFWAHGRFRDRLSDVLECEYNITVTEKSEAGTSSQCPACGSKDVHRSEDLLQCHGCGREGHSDVAGSANFPGNHAAESMDRETSGSMARPAATGENTKVGGHQILVPWLEWDDHAWTVKHDGHSTKEAPVNQSTVQ